MVVISLERERGFSAVHRPCVEHELGHAQCSHTPSDRKRAAEHYRGNLPFVERERAVLTDEPR